MRDVWQRLDEQKKPTIRKAIGIRGSNGKVQLDTQNKLRIDTEYLQNFF